MPDDLLAILGQKHAVRVLLALRARHRLRFTEIQHALELNPAQVDRALKALTRGLWVVPETRRSPGERIVVAYRLGKRGEALLKAFESLRKTAERERSALGEATVEKLSKLYV